MKRKAWRRIRVIVQRQFKKNLDQKSSISCNLRHHLIRSTSTLFYLWRQVISINLVVSLRPTCHPSNHQLSTTLSSLLCLCMFVDLIFLCSKSLSTIFSMHLHNFLYIIHLFQTGIFAWYLIQNSTLTTDRISGFHYCMIFYHILDYIHYPELLPDEVQESSKCGNALWQRKYRGGW